MSDGAAQATCAPRAEATEMPAAAAARAVEPPADVALVAGQRFRAQIGVVLLSIDETAEDSLRRMCPLDVGMHFSRIPKGGNLSEAELRKAGEGLTEGAALIVPGAPLSAVGYACTSSSMLLGDEAVQGLLRAGRPEAEPTSLTLSVDRSLQALGVRRLALATPYSTQITDAQVADFSRRSFRVVAARCLDIVSDSTAARLTDDAIEWLARLTVDQASDALGGDKPDALFISCTQLHAVALIEKLEETLGVRVVTSNQALLWDLLRLAGYNDPISGFGRLMQLPDRATIELTRPTKSSKSAPEL